VGLRWRWSSKGLVEAAGEMEVEEETGEAREVRVRD
jgi:hypothetical protein